MKVGIGILIGITILVAGVVFLNRASSQNIVQNTPSSPSPDAIQQTNITASFTIITDNITRSFKAEKYHNKSPDVYIEASNPTVIHVKKSGITWNDFFQTLPMKLTKDCLITGDGETLCNTNRSLKFYLNDDEDPNLLDKEIKQGDRLKVEYKSS